MIELLIGFLSTIVPIILNLICDKMDEDQKDDTKKEGLDNEIHALTEANSAEDVAVSWANHDYRLRSLLREARQKRSQRS